MEVGDNYRHRRGSRGRPKRMTMFRKSKQVIRWLLKNPWIRPMCIFNYAAVTLQKIFRGYFVRKYKEFGKNWRKHIRTVKEKQARRRKLKQVMLSKYLSHLDFWRSNSSSKMPAYMEEGFSSWCIVRIQAWWRMVVISKPYQRQRQIFCRIAAMDIQSAWRSCLHNRAAHRIGIRGSRQKVNSYSQAAQSIQLCWRSFCNRRIYRFFNDLLKHKLQGEPADLLRAIVPGESDLLDKASGVHVRFRLGGAVFPPKVFFKVYTHRPLCDVNSFAPRNYTSEAPAGTFQDHLKPENLSSKIKQLSTIRVGSRLFEASVSAATNMNTWYRREENNEWRTISATKVEELFNPPDYLRSTSDYRNLHTAKQFHYSRLRRQQDILNERKRRKREWMMKAYMMTATRKNSEISVPSEEFDSLAKADYKEAALGHSSGYKSGGDRGRLVDSKKVDSSFNYEGELRRFESRALRLGSPSEHDFDVLDPDFEASQSKSSISVQVQHNQQSKRSLQVSAPAAAYRESKLGPGAEGGAEEDLLMWSMALDFDAYSNDWLALGTSMPSDVMSRRRAAGTVTRK